MKNLLIYTLSLLILTLSGCNKDKIPGVYRIDIQQGNEISQDMLNQLEPGMTKSQVAYVMGTPLLIDTFHPDRWDYIYSFHPGNGQREQRRVTIYFTEDKVAHIDGNTRVVARESLPQTTRIDSNVTVPLKEPNTGLIQDIKTSIGMDNTDTEAEEKEIIEKDIPQPSQGSGLIHTLKESLTFSDEQGINDQTNAPKSDEEKAKQQTGFFESMKQAVGLGDDEDTKDESTQ